MKSIGGWFLTCTSMVQAAQYRTQAHGIAQRGDFCRLLPNDLGTVPRHWNPMFTQRIPLIEATKAGKAAIGSDRVLHAPIAYYQCHILVRCLSARSESNTEHIDTYSSRVSWSCPGRYTPHCQNPGTQPVLPAAYYFECRRSITYANDQGVRLLPCPHQKELPFAGMAIP